MPANTIKANLGSSYKVGDVLNFADASYIVTKHLADLSCFPGGTSVVECELERVGPVILYRQQRFLNN